MPNLILQRLLANVGKRAIPAKAIKPAAKAAPVPRPVPDAKRGRGRQSAPTAFGHLLPKPDPYSRFPKKPAAEPSFVEQLAEAKRALNAEPPAPPAGSFAAEVIAAKKRASVA